MSEGRDRQDAPMEGGPWTSAFPLAEVFSLDTQDGGGKHLGVQMEGKRALVALEPFPLAGFGLLLTGWRDQVCSPCVSLACPLGQRKFRHMRLLTIFLPSYRKDLIVGWCDT